MIWFCGWHCYCFELALILFKELIKRIVKFRDTGVFNDSLSIFASLNLRLEYFYYFIIIHFSNIVNCS